MSNAVLLEMRGITKRFPGVLALDNISLSVKKGIVLALVGENGAGKSTLMKVISGVYKMDSGDILMEGEPVAIQGPTDSQNLGISIIYQELNVLMNMNIAENIFLGREPKKRGFVDKVKMHNDAAALLERVGLNLSTTTLGEELSVAQRQMVEVAKALSFNTKLIIMDEPTSSITDQETETLFGIIMGLKKEGVSVIFITHRMQEIFKISDEIAIMRDGQMVAILPTKDTSEPEVIRHMVGRDIVDIYAKMPTQIGETALEVRGLSTEGFLEDISFHVCKGEIVGFAGLVGAGRSEVMRAVFGVDAKKTGEIYIDGEQVSIKSTVDAVAHNIGFVPEDRKEQALVLEMTVRNNITLAALKSFRQGLFLEERLEKKAADQYIELLDIRTPSQNQIVNNLSGGNQQKVVISKWMEIKPEILILDEPTRGIDVAAKKEIYTIMSKLAQDGVAIIMISSELPEVLGMADRVIVMSGGRIAGELNREQASQAAVMELALSLV